MLIGYYKMLQVFFFLVYICIRSFVGAIDSATRVHINIRCITVTVFGLQFLANSCMCTEG